MLHMGTARAALSSLQVPPEGPRRASPRSGLVHGKWKGKGERWFYRHLTRCSPQKREKTRGKLIAMASRIEE